MRSWDVPRQALTADEAREDWRRFKSDVGRGAAWVAGILAGLLLGVALLGPGGIGGAGAPRSGGTVADGGPACSSRAGCGQ